MVEHENEEIQRYFEGFRRFENEAREKMIAAATALVEGPDVQMSEEEKQLWNNYYEAKKMYDAATVSEAEAYKQAKDRYEDTLLRLCDRFSLWWERGKGDLQRQYGLAREGYRDAVEARQNAWD